MRPRRPPILRTAAAIPACLLAFACAPEAPAPAPAARNVLLITLDTVRADHLSCYGYARPTTPALDALAADGIRFERAFAQAALTPVSHASILTGLLPPNHGVRVMYAGSGYRLDDAVPTLSRVLQREGFRTGAFLSAFPVSEFFGFDGGFDTFDAGLADAADDAMRRQEDGSWGFDTATNQRRSDATVERALAWLADGDGRPFFTWLHLWDPHDPKVLPPDEDLRGWVDPAERLRSRRMRQIYDAEIRFVDKQIGHLLDALRADGRLDDTIVAVVSDHGEGLGDHSHWHHRILYREQLHVPLIVRIPGEARGTVVAPQVRTVDLAPTVLAALGLDDRMRTDGVSLLPRIRGEEITPLPVYAEALIEYDLNALHLLKARPDDALLYSLSDGTWKLIYKPRAVGRSELYRVADDPGETNNLFAAESDQARRLFSALNELDPFAAEGFGRGEDPEILERLRSLGYVGE